MKIESKICKTCNTEKEIKNFKFRKDTQKYKNECHQCAWQREKPNIDKVKRRANYKRYYNKHILNEEFKSKHQLKSKVCKNKNKSKYKLIDKKKAVRRVKELPDSYLISILTARRPILKPIIPNYPQLIALQRANLTLKRKINGKQN